MLKGIAINCKILQICNENHNQLQFSPFNGNILFVIKIRELSDSLAIGHAYCLIEMIVILELYLI